MQGRSYLGQAVKFSCIMLVTCYVKRSWQIPEWMCLNLIIFIITKVGLAYYSNTLFIDAKRRASAFRKAFSAQLATLQALSAAYGKIGLGEMFEMREECLREFAFEDVYR